MRWHPGCAHKELLHDGGTDEAAAKISEHHLGDRSNGCGRTVTVARFDALWLMPPSGSLMRSVRSPNRTSPKDWPPFARRFSQWPAPALPATIAIRTSNWSGAIGGSTEAGTVVEDGDDHGAIGGTSRRHGTISGAIGRPPQHARLSEASNARDRIVGHPAHTVLQHQLLLLLSPQPTLEGGRIAGDAIEPLLGGLRVGLGAGPPLGCVACGRTDGVADKLLSRCVSNR